MGAGGNKGGMVQSKPVQNRKKMDVSPRKSTSPMNNKFATSKDARFITTK